MQLFANVFIDANECIKSILENQDAINNMYILANQFIAPVVKQDLHIYFTGIGKPGYVAMKQAASLKSIMVNAEFIDATLAGHGDLGSVPMNEPSVLIALSKSGCSKELYGLFDVLKQMRPKCSIVMLCMSNEAQLETVKSCKSIDFICHIPCEPKELDGFGIVPATSNALFEIILANAISNACFNAIGMKAVCERLQMSHPSGTLYNKVTALLETMRKQNAGKPGLVDEMPAAEQVNEAPAAEQVNEAPEAAETGQA